jgi:hypothetical protein
MEKYVKKFTITYRHSENTKNKLRNIQTRLGTTSTTTTLDELVNKYDLNGGFDNSKKNNDEIEVIKFALNELLTEKLTHPLEEINKLIINDNYNTEIIKSISEQIKGEGADRNLQQKKTETLISKVQADIEKINQKIMYIPSPEPNGQERITFWKVLLYFFDKMFSNWKRSVITVGSIIVIVVCYKVFEKDILTFIYNIVSSKLLPMLRN